VIMISAKHSYQYNRVAVPATTDRMHQSTCLRHIRASTSQ